jgi:hypothetical protein
MRIRIFLYSEIKIFIDGVTFIQTEPTISNLQPTSHKQQTKSVLNISTSKRFNLFQYYCLILNTDMILNDLYDIYTGRQMLGIFLNNVFV